MRGNTVRRSDTGDDPAPPQPGGARDLAVAWLCCGSSETRSARVASSPRLAIGRNLARRARAQFFPTALILILFRAAGTWCADVPEAAPAAAGMPWLGVQLSGDASSGLGVAAVIPGSPAERAGLSEGDIVVTFDGNPVGAAQELTRAVRQRKPGDRVALGVTRNGRPMTIGVVLGTYRPLSEEPDLPGPKGFSDITGRAGLAGLHAFHRGSWGDVNGDSCPDLVVERQLFLNRTDGTFEKADLEKAGLGENPGGAVVLADFDNDGNLDAYFSGGEGNIPLDQRPSPVTHPGTGALYLGDGKGRFRKGKVAPNPAPFRAMGAAAADFDGDGWVDLYVANYEKWITEKDQGMPFADVLFRNDHGSLEPAWEAPKTKIHPAYGVTACDFNQDGRIDIYVSNYRLAPNFLWVNTGAGGPFPFVDEGFRRKAAGDVKKGPRGEPLKIRDVNGLEYPVCGHTIGSAWADFDNDGRVDLLAGGRLFRNETKGGNFLKVRLKGTHCNRAAIGAVATVKAGNLVVTRQVEAGTGNGNQNDLALHFGLGDVAGEVSVTVRWPCGKTTEHRVRANTAAVIAE